METVYQILEKWKVRLGGTIHPEAMLHSDQSFHYTHPEYQKRVREMGLRQSMSRRGNCLDNAPMESFFGHMKDEVNDKYCQTFQSLQEVIDEYMQDYHYDRYQWTLKKMVLVQYGTTEKVHFIAKRSLSPTIYRRRTPFYPQHFDGMRVVFSKQSLFQCRRTIPEPSFKCLIFKDLFMKPSIL